MRRRRTVLAVDDSTETLELLKRRLESRGHRVAAAASVDEAVEALERRPFDVVITDLKMPGRSGMELVHHVRDRHPGTVIVMITGYATIQGAVDAVKAGAQEYLAKPFTNAELHEVIDRALARADLVRRRGTGEPLGRFGLVGASTGMRAAFDAMEEALGDDRPVLFVGETGTGRRTAARGLVPEGGWLLDLDALGSRTLESTARAASAGALLRRAELVGSEDISGVRRLASALSRAGARLFASASPAVDERLWGPLHPQRVTLPPVRERGDDVHLLATHFAALAAAADAPAFGEDVRRVFHEYAWPGNVAELEAVVADAVRGASGEMVSIVDLPAWLRPLAGAAADASRSLAEVEAEHIARVLRQTGGNRSRAAEILGINRRTLGEKLKEPKGQKT